MTVTDLKREIATLTPEAQDELTAFLVHLKVERDPEYVAELERRFKDRRPESWIRLEDLEQQPLL